MEFTTIEKVFQWKGQSLTIECIKDIDLAIDELCQELGTDQVNQQLEDLCPYFGIPWEAGLGLTSYLAENLNDYQSHFSSGPILEVGCGLAIPSLYLSSQKFQTYCMDFHPDVEKFLNRNLKRNQLQSQFIHADWTKDELHIKPQFILGADILYEGRHAKDLASRLDILTRQEKCPILIADPGRSYLQSFCDEMKKKSFNMTLKNAPTPHDNIWIILFQK